MSRIEQVMRELSDLREFQIKLERRHKATEPQVADEQGSYNLSETTRLPIAGVTASREQAE